jgi:hypothetical protein
MTWKGRKHRLKSKLGFSNFIPAKWVESIGGYSQDVIIDGKVVSTLSDGKCKIAVRRTAIGSVVQRSHMSTTSFRQSKNLLCGC